MKTVQATLFILVFVLAGCNKSSEPEDQAKPRKNCQCEAESYETQSKGVVKKGFFEGREITYTEVDGLNIWEGDIVLSDEDLGKGPVTEGNITTLTDRKWPNNTVVWAFASGLNTTTKNKWYAAMKHWQQKTRIRFRQRSLWETDYVRVISGEGCYSFIGRIGGAQDLSIGKNCSTGNTLHEIGHAVGLHHEHTRTDRNNSVIVNFDNIEEGMEGSFVICSNCIANGTLDFNSVMMYGSFAFSANGFPTMTTLLGFNFTVQRDSLSANDIAIVKTRYK